MADTKTTWFRTLPESVYALGAAAREYRLALHTAKLGISNTDPSRTHHHVGELAVPGTPFHRPHDVALVSVSDLYTDLEKQVRRLHENAARAYAHGAAWAIRSVLNGKQPSRVLLHREHGEYLFIAEMPDLSEGLARWSGGKRLHALREDLLYRESARHAADSLAAEQRLEAHESAALAAALDSAEALAQTAYDYGELAENALHFAIDRARTNRLPKDVQ
ncbi:hypothetical protein G4Z16_15485 [Streptomyces bathyalis]|uniref:Uncharacterized protein n=1 Tax=Streptomyces bathyalis TaxID=2710756 RepID=A0A7T1T706_9ACTN|nr:hypothetical protein [Streptomyces bathyalis]QPP07558.1 hypothetical protein G4Z16_15485 [Streptomyces bathyalis]